MLVLEFDAVASRSDPRGLLIRYEAWSDQPVVRIDIDLDGDGEPAITYLFPKELGNDGRYNRAFAPKFTVNGTWPLRVTAWDALGRSSSTVCKPGVQVIY